MIFCYSATGRTKVYADVLGKITDRPVYMLQSSLSTERKFSFFVKAAYGAITHKPEPVLNMPGVEAFAAYDDIYLCSPIWAGNICGPMRYFVHTAPIKGKKINMIFVYGANINSSSLIIKTGKLFDDIGIQLDSNNSKILMLAAHGTTAEKSDISIMEEHLRNLLYES